MIVILGEITLISEHARRTPQPALRDPSKRGEMFQMLNERFLTSFFPRKYPTTRLIQNQVREMGMIDF
jgi:hypothetical protein